MRDFTLDTYRSLLQALQQAGYRFVTMKELWEIQNGKPQGEGQFGRICCMRHDVDLRADHSLRTAQIEYELGVQAVYYFRVIPESNQPDIIREIAALNHEIGYHYEDMSICDGNMSKAYEHFCRQLEYFRIYYPVKTICMHGAPTSKYDGRDLWKRYDYRSLGVVCEPYMDLDYSRLFYLTDTGRRWDGFNVSRRDKIPVWQDRWVEKGLVFHSTTDIISALSDPSTLLMREAPAILFTTHPQRWTDNKREWWQEYAVQSVKNVIKRIIIQ